MTITDPASTPGAPAARRRPRATASALAAALAAAALLATGGYLLGREHGGAAAHPMTSAVADEPAMQDRAARVMPFDLSVTTHTFTDTDTGGVEEVVADSPTDRANIDLIRGHLRREAARFAVGDFSDSAAIHGADMPGLQDLAAAAGRLRVTYTEVPAGATLTYASDDAAVVEAIHAWFGAQRHDHGMPGMGG